MKVLLLCHEHPPAGGGAGWSAHLLARELAAMGEEVTLLTGRFAGRRRPVGNGYRLIEVGPRGRRASGGHPLGWIAFTLAGAARALTGPWAARVDVSAAFLTLPAGAAAAALRAARRVPYVISLQGGDVPGFYPAEYGRYHRATAPIIRAIWRRAAALVANSHGLRDLALAAGAPDVAVIPNGVDLSLFKPRARRPPGEAVRLLYVGRFARQKGLDDLLRAFAHASEDATRPAVLDLVGDGPERHHLARLVRDMALEGRVRFSPWMPREDLVERYQAADLFVFPSLAEGMPNAAMEAMACGLPVIGTRVAGTEELVQDGVSGLLVPPGDVEGLGKGLATLIEDGPLRQRMGEGARAMAEGFGCDRMAGAYLVVLERARAKI